MASFADQSAEAATHVLKAILLCCAGVRRARRCARARCASCPAPRTGSAPRPCAAAARARRAGAQRAAFTALDEAYYRAVHRAEAPERDAGATALAALVWGGRLVVANAGDSRAVLSRRGRAINLSRDHKPSCPSERERVATAGARPPRARARPACRPAACPL